jgi:predicted AAA+ superfamily ATPase
MKRISEKYFETWLNKPGRKPLIIRGARQVGKSTLVRQIAANNNRTLFEVNLERHAELTPVFKTMDPGRILREIELIAQKGPIEPSNSVLFIDEIQEIPEAIAALRYLYEERPEIPVVAAGSLLEFALSEHHFSMPVGRVDYYHLGPMSFNEYCIAQGCEDLDNYLTTFRSPSDFSAVAHERLLVLLREYLFTGGMPEVVKAFSEDHDIEAVKRIHASILNTYRDDFAKYGDKNLLPRLRRTFEYIPLSIGEKVTFSRVSRDWKARDVRVAVDMLAQAGIISRIHHTSGAGMPLAAQADDTIFKGLFLDVGLMNALCGAVPLTMEEFQSHRFLHEGALAEQFVGQHLLYTPGPFARPELYYWQREGKSANAEVDYLIHAGKHPLPVEVKAGLSGSLKSLHQFVAAYHPPLALRFDLNPPSMQNVDHTIMAPDGKKAITFKLMSLPLYHAGDAARLAGEFLENNV